MGKLHGLSASCVRERAFAVFCKDFFVFAVREVDLTTGSGFSFDFEEHCVKELGVQDPVGFWDPAGGVFLASFVNIVVECRFVSKWSPN